MESILHTFDTIQTSDTLDTVIVDNGVSADTFVIVADTMQDNSDVVGVLSVLIVVAIIIGVLARLRPIKGALHELDR